MAEWTKLEGVDAAELEALADGLSDILTGVSEFFSAVATTLDALSEILVDEFDPLKDLTASFVTALEAAILDLLENNAYTATHTNVKWDPTWRYDRKSAPTTVPDYKHDGTLPVVGNGLDGWLDDINASAYSANNPFRPVTDEETMVAGFAFVIGVTSANELDTLQRLVSVFLAGWDDQQKIFKIKTALDQHTDSLKPLRKLGAAIGDEFMQNLVASTEGLSGFADPASYRPTPGNYPMWLSVPIAGIIPPIKSIFSQLQKIIAQLKPSYGLTDLLANLASFLAQKAETLSEIAEELSTAIDTLVTLLELLDTGYFIWVEVESGGFAGWINEVRSATLTLDSGEVVGAADAFGSAGLVAGVIGIVTEGDAASHLQTAVRMLTGFDFSPQTTVQSEQLAATFDAEFDGI